MEQLSLEDILMRVSIVDPFAGAFLIGLKKKFVDTIDTAAIFYGGSDYELWVNRDFINKIPSNEVEYVMQHEIGHLCQKVKRLQGVSKDKRDAKIWNIALDISVNQMINLPDESYIGKNGATLTNLNKQYPKLKLKKEETSRYYYDKLISLSEKEKAEMTGIYNIDHLDDYDLTEEEKEVLKHQFKQAMKRAKGAGKLAGEVSDVIKILEASHTNWQNYVRKFSTSVTSFNRKVTKNRVHKRHGPPYEGTKLNKKTKILVGMDTSGSVSDNMISKIGAELNKLYTTGVEIVLVQSDWEVQDIRKFRKTSDIKIKGRGGTSFVPYFEALKYEHGVDGIIIFSDMLVGEENIKQPNCKVLWCSLTKTKAPYKWGTHIEVECEERNDE